MLNEKNLSVQKMSTRKGKPVDKNYTFSDYADLWSLVKNKRRNKRSKKTTRCCEKKRLQSWIIGLIPMVLKKE